MADAVWSSGVNCASPDRPHQLWFSVDHRWDLLWAKFGGCAPSGSTPTEPPPEGTHTVMGTPKCPYIGWSKNDHLLFGDVRALDETRRRRTHARQIGPSTAPKAPEILEPVYKLYKIQKFKK